MNPVIHSESSVKRWGGTVEDYLPLHKKLDCSKAYFSDNRHRALTHTMFWINEVMLPLFGDYIKVLKNDKEVLVSVKDICERHILEDYRNFIPTVQDFLITINMEDWMDNGKKLPPSAQGTKLFNSIYKD